MLKKNVFFLGDVAGVYRSQYVIKYLKDSPNFNIFYCDSNYLTRKPFARALPGFFLSGIFKFIYLVYSDIVFVPILSREKLIWFRLAKLLRKKIIVDFYISMFDTLILDRKTQQINSREARRLKQWDRFLIATADRVIFLSAAELRYYLSIVEVDISSVRYAVIPLCIDPRKKAKLPFANNKSQTFNICWWGTYIPLHGLERIIEMASLLRQREFDFHLYIFGDSAERGLAYKAMVDQLGLSGKVSLINDISFDNGKLEDFLVSHCDLALGNFGDSVKAKKVFLNKIGDAFALSLPVLTMETEALRELVDISTELFICKNDAKEMADMVCGIAKSKDTLKITAELGSKRFYLTFSPQAFFSKLREIF